MPEIHLFSPAGRVARAAPLQRAQRRLQALGFTVVRDPAALAGRQRFAGDDDTRLQALHRVAQAAPDVAMATRGGYGLSRLMDRLDWALLARSVERGTRWVGSSDLTLLQLGLLAHTGAGSWAGPMAVDDFGRDDEAGGLDEVTRDCFVEAVSGQLEAVGFRTEAGFDGLQRRGVLWGGNLSVLCAMLGTPDLPRLKGGVLFLEDVGEHPYRLERLLLQLTRAGILQAQKAVVLGAFTAFKPVPQDRGFGLATVVAGLRARLDVPVLTGLPFGHVNPKVCLPVGRRVELVVQGRDALIGW